MKSFDEMVLKNLTPRVEGLHALRLCNADGPLAVNTAVRKGYSSQKRLTVDIYITSSASSRG